MQGKNKYWRNEVKIEGIGVLEEILDEIEVKMA